MGNSQIKKVNFQKEALLSNMMNKDIKNNFEELKQPNAENEIIELCSDPEVSLPPNDWIYGQDSAKIGQFGGNQSSLIDNVEQFINDPKIYEIINKYYSDYTKEDIEFLFYRMRSVGCGYIAAINTLMLEYIFRDELDFREKVGFNPYELITINGETKLHKDFNYEYLFLDFFLYYQKNFGNFSSIEEIIGDDKEVKNLNEGGDLALTHDPFSPNGATGTDVNITAKVMESYLKEKGIDLNTDTEFFATIYKPGDDKYDEKRKEFYEKNRLDDDGENPIIYEWDISVENIKKALQSGKKIIVDSNAFPLYYPYDKDGNGLMDDICYDNVGPHAMAVVTTYGDDKIVVSSWGEEFLMDADDIYRAATYEY